MRTNNNPNKLLIALPSLVYAVAAIAIGVFTVWTNDTVAYQYFSPVFEESHTRAINSLADVWNSQLDHYMTTNGRFIVHLFVQSFCALYGKIPFAICNGFFWLLLFILSFKLIRPLSHTSYLIPNTSYLITPSLLWIVFLQLPIDPAFQINYIWVATAICSWLILYFNENRRTDGIAKLLWFGLFGVICGSLHEGFSIPISGAICVYALIKRFRLTPRQFYLSIGFGIGTLVVALAPGNFVRLSLLTPAEPSSFTMSVLHFIENGAMLWGLLLLLLIVRFCTRKEQFIDKRLRKLTLLLSLSAAVSFAVCLKIGNLGRIIIPAYFFLALIISIMVEHRKIGWALPACIVAIAVWMTCDKIIKQKDLNEFSLEVAEQYHNSESGIVYDDQQRMLRNLKEVISYKWVHTKRERLENPGKPFITIRPDWMRDPKFEKDTNLFVQVAPQAWVLMQSKTHPADFYIDKVLLPGILDKSMAERKVEFINNPDIVFDTIGPRRVAIYTNTRPYIRSSIRMEPTTTN